MWAAARVYADDHCRIPWGTVESSDMEVRDSEERLHANMGKTVERFRCLARI